MSVMDSAERRDEAEARFDGMLADRVEEPDLVEFAGALAYHAGGNEETVRCARNAARAWRSELRTFRSTIDTAAFDAVAAVLSDSELLVKLESSWLERMTRVSVPDQAELELVLVERIKAGPGVLYTGPCRNYDRCGGECVDAQTMGPNARKCPACSGKSSGKGERIRCMLCKTEGAAPRLGRYAGTCGGCRKAAA